MERREVNAAAGKLSILCESEAAVIIFLELASYLISQAPKYQPCTRFFPT